ncbi:MAG: hypothetical protein JW772_00620 [Candidatus Diapherotrites archaeon]|nr:hypothetical protein [Candidatus Diapherotrites archaeon]
MAVLGNLITGVKKAIPVLAAKVASVLLFFLVVGLFLGFWLARSGYNVFVLVLPLVGLAAMWYKLDEGFLVLILCVILVLVAPELFMA